MIMNISHLKKSFGSKHVLQDINLNVEKGEILGFIGANGSGKTTTLSCLTGSLAEDGGSLEINGITKNSSLMYRRQFFYIPDTIHLFKNVSGRDWIRFVLQLYGREAGEMETYVKRFAMEKDMDKPTGSYSFGMLHKTMLIAAFAVNPPILIMDEPLNGLDPTSVALFKEEVKRYVFEGGTVLFSTHLLDVAEKICTTVAILKDGRIQMHEEIGKAAGSQSLESLFMELQAHVE